MKSYRQQSEAEQIEQEFAELPAVELEECLKAVAACGCDGFVKESARNARETKVYPYFLKLEVLAIRERLKQPELL